MEVSRGAAAGVAARWALGRSGEAWRPRKRNRGVCRRSGASYKTRPWCASCTVWGSARVSHRTDSSLERQKKGGGCVGRLPGGGATEPRDNSAPRVEWVGWIVVLYLCIQFTRAASWPHPWDISGWQCPCPDAWPVGCEGSVSGERRPWLSRLVSVMPRSIFEAAAVSSGPGVACRTVVSCWCRPRNQAGLSP